MPTYIVKSPVKVGGKIHKPDSEPLELDAKTAAPLLASGSLAQPKPQAKDEGKTDGKTQSKK